MSKFRKSFNDIYSQMWELLDKPKLTFWDRNRCKQLLNQLWNEHYNGKWYKKLLNSVREILRSLNAVTL